MNNRTLSLKVALRSPEALSLIKAELARGKGAKAAAEALGVGRTTLARWGQSWPAVAKLLDRYTLDASAVGALGGLTTAERYPVDGAAWLKRGGKRKARK